MNAAETSFYVTGGTLRHDAPSYVERRADLDLSEGLLAGEFCYVLTPRQMGKSSLMVRTASKLRERGVNIIALDLTAIGQNLTPEQWYDGLLARMGRQLRLDEELDRFWCEHERLGPCQRLFSAIRDVVLRHRQGPLAIFVDEIDTVRSLPFPTDEFFAAIRECYNRRAEDPELNRLTFCLLGVATPSDLIRDTRTTPFNIGRRIELHDFSDAEAMPLAQGLRGRSLRKDEHGPSAAAAEPEAAVRNAERLLKRILFWTGGHPYLTQRFCQAVATIAPAAGSADVDRLCEELFLSFKARERDDNLLFVRERLLRSEADRQSLLELYAKARRDRRVADDEANTLVSVLKLSGIVKPEGGCLRKRNRIYAAVFDEHWIQAHLPEAELRRQRAAFYRGVMRTTAMAAIIVTALTAAVVVAVRQATKAQLASAQAYVSQAEATLVSRFLGQRFNALAAIERAAPIYTNQDILRNVALAGLALPDLRPGPVWPGWPEGTACATVSADLAIYARSDRSGSIKLRRTRDDTETAALRGKGAPAAWMMFSPNGSLLGILSRQGSTNSLIVWNWRQNRSVLEVPDMISDRAVDFSPDSRRVAVGLRDGSIEIHSVDSDDSYKRPVTRLAGELPRPPTQLRFHPSAPRLAACSIRGLNVRIWDLDNGTITNSLFFPEPVQCLAWNPHGDMLATGTEEGRICLWDFGAPQPSRRPWKVLPGHEGAALQLAFSHSGDLLASLGTDKTLRLWVPATGRQMTHSPQTEDIEAVSFTTDDRYLGFYRLGTNLQAWEVNPAHAYRPLVDPGGMADEIEDIDLSSDGEILAVATSRGLVLWDVLSGRQLGLLPLAPIRSVAFLPSSDALLTCSSVGIRRWPIVRSGDSRELRLHLGPAKMWSLPEGLGKMAVAPNGKMAAVIRPQAILLYDLADSKKSESLPTEKFYDALALGPEGRLLAARVSNQEEIDFWDTRQLALLPTSAALNSGPNFRFSPDGRWFCTVAAGAYALHEVGTWVRGPKLARKRYANQPGVMAFSGDGRLLALAVAPSIIELVALPSGESLGRLTGPDYCPFVALAFSRDGRILAAAGRENLAMVWDLGDLAAQLSGLKLNGRLPVHPPSAPVTRSVKLTIETSETNNP